MKPAIKRIAGEVVDGAAVPPPRKRMLVYESPPGGLPEDGVEYIDAQADMLPESERPTEEELKVARSLWPGSILKPD